MPPIDRNPSDLHYLSAGKGFPLVLLHAFPVDRRMWEGQIGELSEKFRVIAPDFRGFGQSPAAGAMSIPSMAADIHALLGKLGALPAIVGGCSMGGYVAMNFARQFPADLRGLLLLDTRDAADNPEQRENRDRMIEIAKEKGSSAIADLMIGKLLAPDTLAHRPGQQQRLRAMMEACPASTIAEALVALRDRPDMTEELPKIKTPTLIVVGESDAITPPELAQAMHARIPGSQLAIIPGAGHMAAMEQPTLVTRAILRFVERINTHDGPDPK